MFISGCYDCEWRKIVLKGKYLEEYVERIEGDKQKGQLLKVQELRLSQEVS